MPHDISLDDKGRTTNGHGDGDNWKVDTRKVKALDVDVFPTQNISPQQPSQWRVEGRTKRAIVDAERHGIYCSPEGPVGNCTVFTTNDCLPWLDDATDQDGGTNIRTCKLVMRVTD